MGKKDTKHTARLARSVAVLVAAASGLTVGCKKEPTLVEKIIESAQAPEPSAAPPKDFVFPAMSAAAPKQVIPIANRAAKESPPGQESRIDAWVQQFKLPVVLVGPTRKFASEVGPLGCRFPSKSLQCSIPAKLGTANKYFVASSLSCLDDKGQVLKKADWEAPSKSKLGEKVELEVPESFLDPCLAEGGVKLGIELLGSPCAVPFPHQVRCAGEYDTCRQTCKGAEACLQRCESNRLDCLKICKP